MEGERSSAPAARRRSASHFPQVGNEPRASKSPAQGSGRHTKDRSLVIEDNEMHTTRDDSGGSSRDSISDWEMDDIDSGDDLADDEETGLTDGDKRKRTRRKRRNTMLDERVSSAEALMKEEDKVATQSVLRAALINAILIALWYTFSISISVYNKWMFSSDNLDFHFPLFTTCIHMIVQFGLASTVLYFMPSMRPGYATAKASEAQYTQLSQAQTEENAPDAPPKPLMTKWFYCTRIAPCGAATGLDIGLGNTSLKFISLTFFTMCKSSVLAFVLMFAFLFRLEKPSWKLGGIIVFMTVGVVMMVAGETAFSTIGFILIMSSAFFSGFRWSLTHILLLRNPATSNPFSSIFFLAPVMFISLLVIAIPAEGPAEMRAGFHVLAEVKGTPLALAILVFPGILAFLMTASEFALLKRTSVVTLSVCGIFKEVLTISAAALVFHDALTPINISGLFVTIGSIAAYNYMKVQRMRETAKREAHEQIKADSPILSAAVGRKSNTEDDAGDSNRNSTSDLIKNTLGLQIDSQRARALTIDSRDRERSSPVKRPEDLE